MWNYRGFYAHSGFAEQGDQLDPGRGQGKI
jgi:hypothetical protein